MSFIIGIEVFPPQTAKLRRKPYEVKWNVNGATREQMLSGAALMKVMAKKLEETAGIRFPEGDSDGLSQDGSGRGNPDRDPGQDPGEDGQAGLVGPGREGPGEGV